jgi:hypothetical protein
LTGDQQSYDTVVGFGHYVIDCDDGRKSKFRYLDSGYTGHASESGLDRFHGPGGTPANAIGVLVDAFRVSGERIFLDKAEQLITRCIHPQDDVDSRNLLDTENRWYYTLFVKSLDHYMTRNMELGELDWTYCYARASLVHYARWARRNEYPYLEKPERLEFPNETWAAQDMHKSEMFRAAAKHTLGQEREAFTQRATYFFEYSVKTLSAMSTSTGARATVLMLSFGYAQAYSSSLGVPETVQVEFDGDDFGQPIVFVPQKKRAIRRFLFIAGVAGALVFGALVWLTTALVN